MSIKVDIYRKNPLQNKKTSWKELVGENSSKEFCKLEACSPMMREFNIYIYRGAIYTKDNNYISYKGNANNAN